RELPARRGEEALPVLLAFAVGEVGDDLGVTDQAPGRIAERRDGRACPEAGSIPADAPALVGEVPAAGRRAEHTFDLVPRDLLLRVEDGDVPAEHLIRAVAGEALGAVVPREDAPLRVQREVREFAVAADQLLFLVL